METAGLIFLLSFTGVVGSLLYVSLLFYRGVFNLWYGVLLLFGVVLVFAPLGMASLTSLALKADYNAPIVDMGSTLLSVFTLVHAYFALVYVVFSSFVDKKVFAGLFKTRRK